MNGLKYFGISVILFFLIACGSSGTSKVELDFSKAFITTWEVTKDDKSITIPTTGTGYNYNVDWGDGVVETELKGNKTHTYEKEGEYVVKVIGKFPRIYFRALDGDVLHIRSVLQWGNIKWKSMASAFYGCDDMNVEAKDTPDLSNVTDMSEMFFSYRVEDSGEYSAFDADISKWDISTISNMDGLLGGTKISTSNYDKLLSEWSKLELQRNVTFDAGDARASELGIKSKQEIIENFNWNIRDNIIEVLDSYIQNIGVNETYTLDASKLIASSVDYHGKIKYLWEENKQVLGKDKSLKLDNFSIGTHQLQLTLLNQDELITHRRNIVLNVIDTNLITPLILNVSAHKLDDSLLFIPHYGKETFYIIDWGDGKVNYVRADITHKYINASKVRRIEIKIIGDTDSFKVSDKNACSRGPSECFLEDDYAMVINLLSIEQWGNVEWNSFSHFFYNLPSFDINAVDTPNLSKVIDMSAMFLDSQFDNDISEWNVSNVKNMNAMFRGVTLSTENYDALLNAWSLLNLQKNVVFDGGNSKYSSNSKEARDRLMNDFNWTVTDGGLE